MFRSVEDVKEWVKQIGFPNYAESFAESRVDGDLLLQVRLKLLSDVGFVYLFSILAELMWNIFCPHPAHLSQCFPRAAVLSLIFLLVSQITVLTATGSRGKLMVAWIEDMAFRH